MLRILDNKNNSLKIKIQILTFLIKIVWKSYVEKTTWTELYRKKNWKKNKHIYRGWKMHRKLKITWYIEARNEKRYNWEPWWRNYHFRNLMAKPYQNLNKQQLNYTKQFNTNKNNVLLCYRTTTLILKSLIKRRISDITCLTEEKVYVKTTENYPQWIPA